MQRIQYYFQKISKLQTLTRTLSKSKEFSGFICLTMQYCMEVAERSYLISRFQENLIIIGILMFRCKQIKNAILHHKIHSIPNCPRIFNYFAPLNGSLYAAIVINVMMTSDQSIMFVGMHLIALFKKIMFISIQLVRPKFIRNFI